MIEFSGKLSGKAKFYFIKTEAIVGFVSSIIPSIIVCFLIWKYFAHWFLYIVIPVLLFVIIIITVVTPNMHYNAIMPMRIIIEKDIIKLENLKVNETKLIEHIKQIVDKGEYYKLKFYFPYKSGRFICQKSLITKGTIHDFEMTFANKIKKEN